MENGSPQKPVPSPAASSPESPGPAHRTRSAALPLLARRRDSTGGVILAWIVANSLGVAAIGALIFVVPFLTFIPGRLTSTLVIGLPIGIAQWIALRRVAPVSILWVFSVSAGLLLGLEAVPILGGIWGFADDESVLALSAASGNIAFVVGLVQCVFLRGQFPRSLIWPFGSGIGLGLGTALVLVSDLIDRSGIISIILVTLVYAIATGLAVSWLPTSHRKTESNLVNAT